MPLEAAFDWRSHYTDTISLDKKALEWKPNYPWYSQFGIYNHFEVKLTQQNTTVQFIPRFIFGLPPTLMAKMFPTYEIIPTRGVVTENVIGDKIIIQSFMASVTIIVIMLLKTNAK